jgi:hypothetical protein
MRTVTAHHSFRMGILAILFVAVLPLGCGQITNDIAGPTDEPAPASLQSSPTGVGLEMSAGSQFVGEDEHHDRRHPDEDRLEKSVSNIISPRRGGSLRLLHSKLVIMPRSVTDRVRVTWSIRKEEPEGLGGGLPRIYEFSPGGLKFKTPAKAFISFEDAGVDRHSSPRDYSFYYFDESTGRWEKQKTHVNVGKRRFVVTMHHFSRYAFGRLAEQTSASQE